MECNPKTLLLCVVFILTIQFPVSHSKSIIETLPGYPGNLPFKLETGYVGIGEKEDVQLFYYFVESTRNPYKDPLIFYFPGGPGASALLTLLYQIGFIEKNHHAICVSIRRYYTSPLSFNLDDGLDNLTLKLNPNAWTQMASIIFVDIPAGTGFSYAETKEGWTSSDTNMAIKANQFIIKFLSDHPKFLKNPLYIAGISYIGLVIPKITLELYEGNERGDQPSINIQLNHQPCISLKGYILCNPLTHRFNDFNSRLEYAHRLALISDDIYKSAIEQCNGNYVNVDSVSSVCAASLQHYEECTSRINMENILDEFCDEDDPTLDCESNFTKTVNIWANMDVVQHALNIRQEKIGKWELFNYTIHYVQGKNDTFSYSYDIFSSFSYHKQLTSKNCRALIFSGDHDMTFPYVGVERWITSLNLGVAVPWKPFYVDGQVGGYNMKYARNDYTLTFATVKGAGHVVSSYKPKEAYLLAQRWFSSQTYASDS